MYFKRLELFGFKSFMDKTTLNFEPGITAVVGPNGCGKSNVFDSIRWVLGEQSAKSLRGAQMEDVIFNGTDKQQPVGMAEVSLTFDNKAHFFPVDHDEVMITRRLFRSGESEYLLNKAQVRLKDITELLLGTGIGAESYSIIAQGKIDLVLSSKPEERRQVFDEASGITKFKAQKREALRRLEETENNLLRINDIITEVRRSIGYLERQANKARRYQAAFAELKQKELQLGLAQKASLVAEKQKYIIQINALRNQEEQLQLHLQEEEAAIAQKNVQIRQYEEELDRIKNDILTLENLNQHNSQHISFNRERIKELEQSKAYFQTQIVQTRERLVQDQEKLARMRDEQTYIIKNIDEKTVALRENEAQMEQLVAAVRTATESIASSKKAIMEIVTSIAHLKNELTDVTSKHQVTLSRKRRLEVEKYKVEEEKGQVEGSLQQILADVSQMQAQLVAARQEFAAVASEDDAEHAALAQVQATIESLEKQLLTLQSQKEFLEKLRSQYEDISESMNARIYLDKKPGEMITGLVVRIKDIPQGAAAAGLSGAAEFECTGEAKPIDLNAEIVTKEIARIEGELVVLRQTKAEKEKRIQELDVILGKMNQTINEQETALSNKKAVHQTVLEQFNKISDEGQIVMLELGDVETELQGMEEKVKAVQQRIADSEHTHKELELSIHDAQETISGNTKLKEQLLIVVTQAKTELENLNSRLAQEEQELSVLAQACSQDEQEISTLEERLKDTGVKQEALGREIVELEEKISQTHVEIGQKNTSLSEGQQGYKELSAALEALVKGVEEKRKHFDTLKDQLYELQMHEKDIEFQYQTLKTRLMESYKIDLEQPAPAVEPAPVVASAAEGGVAVSAEQPAQSDQPVQPQEPQSVSVAPVQDEAPVLTEAQLAEEVSRLKEKIGSYGTVNLVAIEEYDELKKRYDFLTQQQTDLANAKAALQEAIQKINRTTKKMFVETFQKVQEEFRNYFRLLFNGGDAQVYLVDENDPLECGIEIICRPPGKKLQNVLLLSGGEKSMAAIALIFAIFKVKPAPFCILDEIDAALDEANVDRFGRMLQEFSRTAQFIVITHNKRTIANAGVMYGITMQESGVSKIVSVKFSDKKAEEEVKPQPAAEEPQAVAA